MTKLNPGLGKDIVDVIKKTADDIGDQEINRAFTLLAENLEAKGLERIEENRKRRAEQKKRSEGSWLGRLFRP